MDIQNPLVIDYLDNEFEEGITIKKVLGILWIIELNFCQYYSELYDNIIMIPHLKELRK